MEDVLLLGLNTVWQIATLGFVALGLAIVFGLLRIMNMAHGEFVMIGAYAPVITTQLGLSPWMQIPVCILSIGVIAFLCERLLIRHFYDRIFDSLLATWGLSLLLRELVELTFGRSFQSVISPFPGTASFLGTSYPSYRLAVLAGLLIFFTVLTIWYRQSLTATRIKAMVANPVLAQAAGINTARLSASVFVVGCIISGLSGLMLAPLIRVEPFIGLDYLLRCFFILVLGGLGSLEGLGIGAVVIGGLQTIVGTISDQTGGYLTILLVSIFFLWLRPRGIYSKN
jgi:branched-chain amino acid transport system permease protein/urea transport system permease protein